jgi:beta-glucosidase
MAPDSWRQLYANTLAQVRSGEIPMSRIEDADRRILRVKLRAHLFDEGRPSSRPLSRQFGLLGSPDHRAVARRAVRESLVLLKNSNHLLPLNPRQHVLVAGDGADSIGKQSGGWTITWQGTGVTNMDFPHGETLYAGIQRAVQSAGGTADLTGSGDFKTKPDVAIVVFGENPYAEFQGDLGSVEYSAGNRSDLELLRRLHSQGVPVVAVFLSGRPLWVNPHINASDAFVAAWLPGTEGGGVADVLFKAPDGSVPYDFHGKLSFSWPGTLQAVHRGDAIKPLFAYGYGLTYRDKGDLRKLPEDGGTSGSAGTDTQVFFTAGKPGSGWSWFASQDAGVRMSATDLAVQEDSRQIRWSGKSNAAALPNRTVSVGLSADAPVSLQRETNAQLSLGFDYRVDRAPTSEVTLQVACGPGCQGGVDLTKTFTAARPGEWAHLKVPLLCFAHAGTRMETVTRPFVLDTAGQFGVSVANIRLESGADVLPCAP